MMYSELNDAVNLYVHSVSKGLKMLPGKKSLKCFIKCQVSEMLTVFARILSGPATLKTADPGRFFFTLSMITYTTSASPITQPVFRWFIAHLSAFVMCNVRRQLLDTKKHILFVNIKIFIHRPQNGNVCTQYCFQ